MRFLAECASGSMSSHVCKAKAWPAFKITSSPVAMPPHSSTRWMGLWGRVYFGKVARGGDGGISKGERLGGLGRPVGRVCKEIDAGQTKIGLVCGIEGVVMGRPLLFLVFGKKKVGLP